MKLCMVGCHHHRTNVELREQLAFNSAQAEEALLSWRDEHPEIEAVLLSTCHRVELYAAADYERPEPTSEKMARHLADFHQLPVDSLHRDLISLQDGDVVRHLFRVAASLDSMVVGEPQILAQVKRAYEMAHSIGSTGPVTHQFFQAALRAARRVANETSLHRHRVSIPSVAIADFARRIFERFDDKQILVIGAGEMAEETLRYLVDSGARHIRVANRNQERAMLLAENWYGRPAEWDNLYQEIAQADLVISTTGSEEAIVTREKFHELVVPLRNQRPIFVLDLAVPRDFDPRIGDELGIYLYSVDDLATACERNRDARQKALPEAENIVEVETLGFLTESRHRVSGPVIAQLKRGFEETKSQELRRLLGKLDHLSDQEQREIELFADRLVGKLLHPPMESLRDVSKSGSPRHLLDALRRLFQLKE